MRLLLLFSAIIAALALGALRFATTRGADENWTPVHLPFPAPRSSVAEEFHLYTGGEFAVEAVTAALADERDGARREGRSVVVPATITITGPRGMRTTVRLGRMTAEAWTTDTTEYFAGNRVQLPRAGDYEIVLRSDGVVPLFATQGAIIRLERAAPFEYRMWSPVIAAVAYLALGAAILVMIAAARARTRPQVSSRSV